MERKSSKNGYRVFAQGVLERELRTESILGGKRIYGGKVS